MPSYAELLPLAGGLRSELGQVRAELTAARAEIAGLRTGNDELRSRISTDLGTCGSNRFPA